VSQSILQTLMHEVENCNAAMAPNVLGTLAEYLPLASREDIAALLSSWAQAARERAARRMSSTRGAKVLRLDRVLSDLDRHTAIDPKYVEQSARDEMAEDLFASLQVHIPPKKWFRVRLETSEAYDPLSRGKKLTAELMFEPMQA